MSQHDYNIANQTFSATRTDLNNALGAVATNNAGNSEPSTTYANQWWFDSDGNTLYMRNKDNDAWVRILEIGATSDETQRFGENIYIDSDGKVGIGTASPAGQLDVQQSTTDMVGLSILNTNASGTTTSSQLRIGMTNSAGASYAVMKVQEGGSDDYPDIIFGVQNAATTTPTERMRIKDTGEVGIGETAPLGKLHVKTADSGSSAHANADEFVIEGSAYSGMTIASGTTSHGTIAFADSGDELAGRIVYNHSTNALSFGAAGVGTQWSINSDGNLLAGNSTAQGIHLGVTSAGAANLLDDYEEGTYTVALGDTGGNVTVTLNDSFNELGYTKVGRLVTFGGTLVVASISGSWGATDTTTFTLPFASADLTDQAGKIQGTLGTYNTNWTSGTSPYVQVGEGGSLGYMYVSADNAVSGRVQVGGGTQLYIGGHYYTA
jgi:hypothetical protein